MDDRTEPGAVTTEIAADVDTTRLILRARSGSHGHRLVIEPGVRFTETATVSFIGTPSTVTIGRDVRFGGAIVASNGAAVAVGERSTFGRVELVADVAGITIGADCMFSFDIELRTTDAHPLYDVRTRERLNPPRPIVVEDYVWVGKQVTVSKGVTLGSGSAVALRSVVTKPVPQLSTVAGIPAKVVRRGTIWTRYTKRGVLDDDRVATGYLAQLLPAYEAELDTDAEPAPGREPRGGWRRRGG